MLVVGGMWVSGCGVVYMWTDQWWSMCIGGYVCVVWYTCGHVERSVIDDVWMSSLVASLYFLRQGLSQ